MLAEKTMKSITVACLCLGMSGFAVQGQIAKPVKGDYDGDGLTDLTAYDTKTGVWHIFHSSTPNGLNGLTWGGSGKTALRGDFTGDGVNDPAVYDRNTAMWHVLDGVTKKPVIQQKFGGSKFTPVVGDFNGDKRADLAVFNADAAEWWVIDPDRTILDTSWGWEQAKVVPGDYNGDGRSDLAVFDQATGDWYIQGALGAVLAWKRNWGFRGAIPVPGDYNGDGRSDLAVYNPVSGEWYIQGALGATLLWRMQWGFPGALPAAANVGGEDDGDDLIIFDPRSAAWYAASLSGRMLLNGKVVGEAGGLPVPGHYSGGRTAELATFVNGSWKAVDLGGTLVAKLSSGVVGGTPLAGDFNGDGRDDLATFDPENNDWYFKSLNSTPLVAKIQHGYEGVIPVVGDFDGDGIDDLGVYDSAGVKGDFGDWYIRTVAGAWLAYDLNWGGESATPLAGDFNGDRNDDLAVYNLESGVWHVLDLGTQAAVARVHGKQWGYRGAVAVGAPGTTESWDGIHALGGTSVPTYLPYDQDWVAEFDFINMSVTSTWHLKFLDADPVGWSKFQMFRDNQGGLGVRLANRKINLIADGVGTTTTSAPPDHWGRTGAAVPIGNHKMRLEYSYSTRRFRIIWDEVLVGDFGMNILSVPSPITYFSLKNIGGGEFRYRVGPIL